MEREAKTAKPIAVAAAGLRRFLGEGDNRVEVLRGVDLEVGRGSTCAVVGPSGCGKSTLLYLLGLLDRPDEGEVLIDQQDLATASDAQRTAARNASIGFVFQFHFLLGEFRAWENVALPMRKLGLRSPAEIEERARSLLKAMGLGDKADRLATALSGGEQQRVAIARALANEPAIILADEPTGNLDSSTSQHVFELLQETRDSASQPGILIVTHNEQLAQSCDRVLAMADGRFVSH